MSKAFLSFSALPPESASHLLLQQLPVSKQSVQQHSCCLSQHAREFRKCATLCAFLVQNRSKLLQNNVISFYKKVIPPPTPPQTTFPLESSGTVFFGAGQSGQTEPEECGPVPDSLAGLPRPQLLGQ